MTQVLVIRGFHASGDVEDITIAMRPGVSMKIIRRGDGSVSIEASRGGALRATINLGHEWTDITLRSLWEES